MAIHFVVFQDSPASFHKGFAVDMDRVLRADPHSSMQENICKILTCKLCLVTSEYLRIRIPKGPPQGFCKNVVSNVLENFKKELAEPTHDVH